MAKVTHVRSQLSTNDSKADRKTLSNQDNAHGTRSSNSLFCLISQSHFHVEGYGRVLDAPLNKRVNARVESNPRENAVGPSQGPSFESKGVKVFS